MNCCCHCFNYRIPLFRINKSVCFLISLMTMCYMQWRLTTNLSCFSIYIICVTVLIDSFCPWFRYIFRLLKRSHDVFNDLFVETVKRSLKVTKQIMSKTKHISVVFLIFSSTLSLVSYSQSLSTPSTVTDNCLVTFDSINATFNLCPARIGPRAWGKKYYQVEDSRNINNEDNNNNHYEYYFNIGGPLQIIHPICINMTQNTDNIFGYCPDENNCDANTLLTPIEDPAWVYQVWYNKSNDIPFRCYRLSNQFGGPPQWSLYHEGDPSLGIQVTYLNGDHINCKTNRKFNIRFLCANEILFIPDEYPLYEYTECEYTVELPSIYGCPIQCPEYDFQLCAGNGLCGFDFTINKPHCFCYHKWTGYDCSIPNPTAIISNDSIKIPPNPSSPFVKDFPIDDKNNIHVVYDLSEFAVKSEVYIVTDLDYSRNHTYYVGIPEPVLPPSPPFYGTILPIQCENIIKPCANISSSGECVSGIEFGTDWAYIFQLDTNTNECRNLGTKVRWEMYDENNPSGGVTGVYYDGSWCHAAGKNMELRIHLVCPKDQDKVYHPRNETKIDLFEYVEWDDNTGCSVSFTHFSAIACPYQCVAEALYDNITTFTVCDQKGFCAADPNAGFVRCLCDDGWTGIDCQQIATNDPTEMPTIIPTMNPTFNTGMPTMDPTEIPTVMPSVNPSVFEEMLTTEGQEEMIEGKEDKKGMSLLMKIIIIWIVIAVLLIIGIGWCIYKRRKQKLELTRINSSETTHQRLDSEDFVTMMDND
eukprot:441216_1